MGAWPIEERDLDELALDMRNVSIPGDHFDDLAVARPYGESALG